MIELFSPIPIVFDNNFYLFVNLKIVQFYRELKVILLYLFWNITDHKGLQWLIVLIEVHLLLRGSYFIINIDKSVSTRL